ncbi:MAG: hypothetical protein H8D46_03270 [FCB group bacterium]|nr:hypothetical protein [FCB group bacterium]
MEKNLFKVSFLTLLLSVSILTGGRTDAQTLQSGFAAAAYRSIISSAQSLQNRNQEFAVNLVSSAPADEIIFQFDLENLIPEDLSSAIVFYSMDLSDPEQGRYSADCLPIGTAGYEHTWECSASLSEALSVEWYLQLILSDGSVYYTQSFENISDSFPPAEALLAQVTSEPAGDHDGDDFLDLVSLSAGYGPDRLYIQMETSGSGFYQGDFFGPWYLYGAGFSDPDIDFSADTLVVYSLGYGNGAFGNLYPGLMKLYGTPSGDIIDFEYITEDIEYEIDGNQLKLAIDQSYIFDDSEFGDWPNSLNGLMVSALTASTTLEVDFTIFDSTAPGYIIFDHQFQYGNSAPVVEDFTFNETLQRLSVNYTDGENNLPVVHRVTIDNTDYNLLPDSHDYANGVTFSVLLPDLQEDEYTAVLHFDDGALSVYADFEFAVTFAPCVLPGDINRDGFLDISDVVAGIGFALYDVGDPCGDMNGSGTLDVLDLVIIVYLILH